MIQLLAIDMDGTCLNQHNKISQRTMNALQLAADAGIMIVPTTGRALSCLPHQIAGRRGLFRYVISSNGAEVTDCLSRQSVFSRTIDKRSAIKLLRLCKREKLAVCSHINHEYLVQGYLMILLGYCIYGKDASRTKYVKNMAKAIRESNGNLEELQLYFLAKDAVVHMKRILPEFPELSAAYDKSYVEIFPQNTSKGRGLLALANHLKIPRDAIACIGDGENDLSMFRVSGYRFAMGNAVPALKRQADCILPSNRDDGVAEAIIRYIL